MPRQIRTDDPERLDDKRLVARISEFRSAQAACERELTKLVAEFQARRVKRVRNGEPAERKGEEAVLVGNELNDAIRREQIAAQHREADEALRRDPRSPQLIGH